MKRGRVCRKSKVMMVAIRKKKELNNKKTSEIRKGTGI
jgi:hypothetical protein